LNDKVFETYENKALAKKSADLCPTDLWGKVVLYKGVL
jgi:hypothetical protein